MDEAAVRDRLYIDFAIAINNGYEYVVDPLAAELLGVSHSGSNEYYNKKKRGHYVKYILN